jgi:hypothetical protein
MIFMHVSRLVSAMSLTHLFSLNIKLSWSQTLMLLGSPVSLSFISGDKTFLELPHFFICGGRHVGSVISN